MPGTLTIEGMSAGLVGGESVIGPVTTTGSGAAVGTRLSNITLNSGDNTYTVPTGASALAVFLGTSGTSVTVKVRTNLNSLEAGLAISPPIGITPWFKMDLVTGMTTIYLNASGSLAGVELDFI